MFMSCYKDLFFLTSNLVKGERDNVVTLVAAKPSPVRGIGFYLCYPSDKSLFSPTSGGSGGILHIGELPGPSHWIFLKSRRLPELCQGVTELLCFSVEFL